MKQLLVIDDDRLILDCFKYLFPASDVALHTAATGTDGMTLFRTTKPDAVLLDVQLPDGSGLEFYRRLHEIDRRTPIMFMTGQGTSETAIEAMRLGAFDYVVKPFDPDEISDLIRRAFHISHLMRVPAVMAQEGAPSGAEVLVGKSAAMQDVYKAIGRVAPQDVGVLVLGESGTGKEMVARAIYHYSKRSSAPFLAMNCAAIPEQLLESELFGHEKGAFTGAERRRIGKFEQCSGGTLFLDEIGDMTPLTQTKILRVLQDQQFERIGGNETIKTDVRIIAATNRNLEQLMNQGQFRADLYYRLNGYTIRIPALKERHEDLALLACAFLKRYARELGKEVQSIAPEAMAKLSAYPWPGNVRELQSVIRQAILQATGPVLVAEFLPPNLSVEAKPDAAQASCQNGLPDLHRLVQHLLQKEPGNVYDEVLHKAERLLFAEVLKHTNNNQSQASRILGITRQTLRNRLAALGMEKAKAEEGDEA
jgi:DNA-binding NtrC family response regulator